MLELKMHYTTATNYYVQQTYQKTKEDIDITRHNTHSASIGQRSLKLEKELSRAPLLWTHYYYYEPDRLHQTSFQDVVKQKFVQTSV